MRIVLTNANVIEIGVSLKADFHDRVECGSLAAAYFCCLKAASF
jgi:hypothetical protein